MELPRLGSPVVDGRIDHHILYRAADNRISYLLGNRGPTRIQRGIVCIGDSPAWHIQHILKSVALA